MMMLRAGEDDTQPCTDYQDFAMDAALLEAQQKRQSHGRPGTHEPFPVQLHWVLEQTEKDGLSHIVRWASHGRAFVVHHRELFVEQILPVYFNQSKFTSFQRQLSLYGFRRLTKGPDRGGYYHPKFLRISRTFVRNISRTKVKNEGPRKAATPESEPDLYKLPKLIESIGHTGTDTSITSRATFPTPCSATQMTPVSDLREPYQQIPSARLRSDSTDVSGASLAFLAQRSRGLLPSPEVDHHSLLTSQLQLQNQRDTLLNTNPANFSTLQAQLPPHSLRLVSSPTWLPTSSTSLLGALSRNNVPTLPDWLPQSTRVSQGALAASPSEQPTLFGSQRDSEVSRGPSALSDAVIAQLLGLQTGSTSFPTNSKLPGDGTGRGR